MESAILSPAPENDVPDYIHHPEGQPPTPLINESGQRLSGERRLFDRSTLLNTRTQYINNQNGHVRLIEKEFDDLTEENRTETTERIAKILGKGTANVEIFSMDTLPIFREHLRELFEKGWIATIRMDAFDRFGTPLYPWTTFGESEELAKNGRFIALIRMPKNMKAANFIKPMDPQTVVDASKINALGFGTTYSKTSHITIATCEVDEKTGKNGKWDGEVIAPNIEYTCFPLEQIKQYGTGLFEGIGVERNEDNEVMIFGLKDHRERMSRGGEFLEMPPIPYELFERMVVETIQANWAYIPPTGQGRLYVRPDWFDHGPKLKVGNSHQYTLLMCAVPIGSAESYFKRGRKKFFMAKGRARVAEGGNIGWLKMDGSYSPTIDLIHKAEAKGMAGVIFTNAAGNRVEETNASSIIFIRRSADGKHKIITPSLEHGTILDSITRKTILKLAEEKGWIIEERDISPDELEKMAKQNNMEAIAVGTAAAVAPIHEIQVGSVDKETNEINPDGALIQISPDGDNERGPVSQEIFEALMAVKSGKAQKEMRAELKTEITERKKMAQENADTTQIDARITNSQRKLKEQEGMLTLVPHPNEIMVQAV